MSRTATSATTPRGATALQALDVGQSLTDTFIYRASDGTFLSSAATVTITVQGRNDAPTAVTDTQFTDQNKTVDVNVVANDLDPEKHPLTVTGVSGGVGTGHPGCGPQHRPIQSGRQVQQPEHRPVGHRHVHLPSLGRTRRRRHGHGRRDDLRPERSAGGRDRRLDGGEADRRTTEQSPVTIPVLANDTDPEGTELTVTNVQLVGNQGPGDGQRARFVQQHGHLQPQRRNSSPWGSARPPRIRSCTWSRTRTATRPLGTVTVTIDGLNDAPTAVNDTGARVARNGTVNDQCAKQRQGHRRRHAAGRFRQPGRHARHRRPQPGQHRHLQSQQQFNYLKIGQEATDRFTYTISDGQGGTSEAAVTVTIFGASDPPVAVNDR